MQRLWIILRTEIKAWRKDPITTLGGILPPLLMMIAFGLLFGERPTFKIAVLNHDTGSAGAVLIEAFGETLSPFGVPYYDILPLAEAEAWAALRTDHLDGVWVIPADFSQRLAAGQEPQLDMYFSNYIDDLAKNHRIYQAEVIWRLYEKIGMPPPPLSLREEYPLPVMVEWFQVIGVGLVLMSFILGGMMNIMMLTYKEQISRITLEFGLSPRALGWVLVPKILLALTMSLLTGTIMLFVLSLWIGVWPGRYLLAVWTLASLVALFWIALVLLVGLRVRHFLGAAIGVVLTGMVVFFVGGGLSMIRNNQTHVPWFSWLFPNTHAIDPLRDLILFDAWPADWTVTLLKLIGFAAVALLIGIGLGSYRLRRYG
ncbi:MAG: ABC transporter permease [Anaerolineae bacterium]|nr:ABC transporter permease [Anaerolineae bacterium]